MTGPWADVEMPLGFEEIRTALLRGEPLTDSDFDSVYPLGIRRASRRFWTPLQTARRAATLLAGAGARSVLDVGAGVGKFALVAVATVPHLHVVGIEQRAQLVQVARTARVKLTLESATFVHGNATDLSWHDYDGLYFYNSFAENLFARSDWLDDRAELTGARFARDVLRTVTGLRTARVGTVVVTFHGSSGRIPRSYELCHEEASGSGRLRLWVKRHLRDDGSFFVEDGDAVVSHDAGGQRI
jgi:SAM-dependent methyltransferase